MADFTTTADDAQLARDMELAYKLQAKEVKRQQRRRNSDSRDTAAVHAEDSGVCLSHTINANHMLFVLCEVDGRPVHVLVDTGASSSAMSLTSVHRLGLSHKLNRNISGQASGVGATSIVGVVEGVELLIGNVEFRLFFLVLEADWPYIILGLDQMRRFKCQVDLDENRLVFGGKDGVSVPFLSPELAQLALEQQTGDGSGDSSDRSPSNTGARGLIRGLFGRR